MLICRFRFFNILQSENTAPITNDRPIHQTNCLKLTKLPITENNLISPAPIAPIRKKRYSTITGKDMFTRNGTIAAGPCIQSRNPSPVIIPTRISRLLIRIELRSCVTASIVMPYITTFDATPIASNPASPLCNRFAV